MSYRPFSLNIRGEYRFCEGKAFRGAPLVAPLSFPCGHIGVPCDLSFMVRAHRFRLTIEYFNTSVGLGT